MGVQNEYIFVGVPNSYELGTSQKPNALCKCAYMVVQLSQNLIEWVFQNEYIFVGVPNSYELGTSQKPKAFCKGD